MDFTKKMTETTLYIHKRVKVYAKANRCQFYTPEMFLYVMVREHFMDEYFELHFFSPKWLEDDIVNVIEESDIIKEEPVDKPLPSLQYEEMMGLALSIAESCGQDKINIPHVVSAMLKLEESNASYLLNECVYDAPSLITMLEEKYKVSEDGAAPPVKFSFNVVTKIEKKDDEGDNLMNEDDFMDDDMDEDDGTEDYDDLFGANLFDGETKQRKWRSMVTCLNDEVENHNPLIGREQEMERIMQVLCRCDKNNPLLLGEPGVGKTAMVYGLVERIKKEDCPCKLQGCNVYMMDLTSMIAGTQYRGEFEKKLKLVLEGAREEGGVIIYIDEIHNIVGAGKSSDGALDASNMLKPYLENGSIRFIGTTTYEEYNKYMAGSTGITRRFQQVDIAEPSAEDTMKILSGLKKRYEEFHHFAIGSDIMEYVVNVCQRHMSDRRFPDKAIDIIDETGAYLELHPKDKGVQHLDKATVDKVVAKLCRIDAEVLRNDDNKALEQMQQKMLARVFGQDDAVSQVVEAVQMAKAGLTDDDKPLASLLFVGPTGVGKTEVARSLADVMGVTLVRFDMSEYVEKHAVAKLIGSPAGYVGYEDGGLLVDAIRKSPNCVLLLDEIEKAHPDIYNILLQVMDYARLTDNRGRQADFHNVIVIMTSNAGAQYASQASIGFNGGISRGEAMMKQVKKTFKPEFINRLSATVVFHEMSHDMASMILHKKLVQLQEKLAGRNVELILHEKAEEWLLDKGYTQEYGAREMDRAISRHLKPLLMREILFGSLQEGGKAIIIINENQELTLWEKKN